MTPRSAEKPQPQAPELGRGGRPVHPTGVHDQLLEFVHTVAQANQRGHAANCQIKCWATTATPVAHVQGEPSSRWAVEYRTRPSTESPHNPIREARQLEETRKTGQRIDYTAHLRGGGALQVRGHENPKPTTPTGSRQLDFDLRDQLTRRRSGR